MQPTGTRRSDHKPQRQLEQGSDVDKGGEIPTLLFMGSAMGQRGLVAAIMAMIPSSKATTLREGYVWAIEQRSCARLPS